MNFEKVNLVYFSPTKTTKRIIESIADGTGVKEINLIDLTTNNSLNKIDIGERDLTIFGAPVYGGRIPVVAAERFKNFSTIKAKAIVVAVYGNRAYEDALLELKNICELKGFNVIAAGTFIGEHSFSFNNIEVAKNRPDKDDLKLAFHFGEQIINKLKTSKNNSKLVVPGNIPHRELKVRPELSPDTIDNDCILCGDCVNVCPTGAVNLNSKIETNKESCIWCCACVKVCEKNARVMKDSVIVDLQTWLVNNFSERLEPEVFL